MKKWQSAYGYWGGKYAARGKMEDVKKINLSNIMITLCFIYLKMERWFVVQKLK